MRFAQMNSQSLVIVFLAVIGISFGSERRLKRVINGVPLKDYTSGRPSTYTAIRYYGVITSAHIGNYLRRFLQFFGNYGDVLCSGSIVTPKVFQTACHCVATPKRDVNDQLKPVFINDRWENRAVVYLGVSHKFGDRSMQTYSPILVKRFIVHQKCAIIGDLGQYTHDYAVIQLPYEWIRRDDRPPSLPWSEIEFTPQYTIKQMRDFQEYAQMKQLVCFHIGFGQYLRNDVGPKSAVLLTGWEVLTSQSECLHRTFLVPGKPNPDWELMNWVCSRNFSHHEQESGEGDSGGPISCSNRLFGVVHGGISRSDRQGNTFDVLDKYHTIYSNLFVNAIEYRQDLIHSIDDLKESYRDVVDEYFRTSHRTVEPQPGFVLKMDETESSVSAPPRHSRFCELFAWTLAMFIRIL